MKKAIETVGMLVIVAILLIVACLFVGTVFYTIQDLS
jgi:hypothetical protein